ncbi:MAG: hypothetical protein U0163_12035 [Gemmatimonadaceae bacterium]
MLDTLGMANPVLYLPIITTGVALSMAGAIAQRYRSRGGGAHLAWWTAGAITYAAGTVVEASVTLFGWHPMLFRLWYIFGALMGGAPLAQGAVYLHASPRTARRLSIALVAVIASVSVLVLLTPLTPPGAADAHRLTGRVMDWQWIRAFSPFINLYAFVFLVGGAVRSAVRFAKDRMGADQMWGNVCIAIGALLPGIGGSFTRFGYTEVLYVTELLGIILIYIGYRRATRGVDARRQASGDLSYAIAR